MVRSEQELPRARKAGLLVESLPDEVLVYDLERQKAHCLNETAAFLWDHCDGATSTEDLRTMLENRSAGEKISSDVVSYGLDQLYRARLLESRGSTSNADVKLSRRELVKRIGLAVSIPIVVSIIAPTASAALSCVGRPCVTQANCGPCTCDVGAGVCT